MQQERDDLDALIEFSMEDYREDPEYNSKLLARLQADREQREQSYIAAFSLIMAGFLAIFIYTSGLQYRLLEFQTKARTYIVAFQSSNNGSRVLKYIIGE